MATAPATSAKRYNIRLRPALLRTWAAWKEIMPTDIIMPQMGESIVEGTITKWLKKPGDKVQRDEPLFEISTDKVDAEIPAPASGVLQEIKVTEGTTVGVNTVVGTIAVDGEAAAAPAKSSAAKPAAAKPEEPKPEEKKPEEKKAAPPRPAQPPRPPLTKRKRKPAPHPWSARSPASTESVSPKFPAPDSAAASPNKTSCRSSKANHRNRLLRDGRTRPYRRAQRCLAVAPVPQRRARARQLPRPTPAISSP